MKRMLLESTGAANATMKKPRGAGAMKRAIVTLFLCTSLLVSASAATGSTHVFKQCGTVRGAGRPWTVGTINLSCAFAKSWFPKLLKEKWYGKVRRSALIKPPTGFKPCGVSFPRSGGTATYVAIECTKKTQPETVMTFTRM
jgi:hypothetical protein